MGELNVFSALPARFFNCKLCLASFCQFSSQQFSTEIKMFMHFSIYYHCPANGCEMVAGLWKELSQPIFLLIHKIGNKAHDSKALAGAGWVNGKLLENWDDFAVHTTVQSSFICHFQYFQCVSQHQVNKVNVKRNKVEILDCNYGRCYGDFKYVWRYTLYLGWKKELFFLVNHLKD